jgi:hypothetical protein
MQGLMHERVRDVIADVLRMAPTKITDQTYPSGECRGQADFFRLTAGLRVHLLASFATS